LFRETDLLPFSEPVSLGSLVTTETRTSPDKEMRRITYQPKRPCARQCPRAGASVQRLGGSGSENDLLHRV